MNCVELKEVINYFNGVKTGFRENRLGNKIDVYQIGPLTLHFSGSYYTVVEGKVPFSVAERIFDNYDNFKYRIRVGGGAEDWTPSAYVVDDKYLEDIRKGSFTGNMEEYHELRRELRKRDDAGKYIDTYHVDTLEGLIILIIEVMNLNLNYQEVYKEIIRNIYNKHIDHNVVMDLDKRVIASINNNSNENRRKSRELINQFDQMINPLNKNLEALLNNFKLVINHDRMNSIMLKDDKDYEVTYRFDNKNFAFQLVYIIDNKTNYFFSHYVEEGKEFFIIQYNSEDDKFYRSYDLTNERIEKKSYGDDEIITDEDYRFLYSELKNAIYILENLIFNKEEVKIGKL